MKSIFKSGPIFALIFALPITATLAHAQQYPNKPIRMIVPFPPGGGTDLVSRIVGQKMTESLGQSVVIENRAGAQGNIGTALAAKAAPDGYTLVLGEAGTLGINPHLYASVGYDPSRDFAPISLITRQPYLLVANPSFPPTTIAALLAYAKVPGNKVSYGTSGAPAQIAGELFKLRTGVAITHVPYKGGGPALTDLLGGHINLTVTTPAPVLVHIREGRLRVIAVTTRARVSFLANVPTMIESGVPDFDISGWYGYLAPAGTPRDIITRLNTEFLRIAKLADVQERLTREGAQVISSTPEEFAAHIRDEGMKWGEAVARTGVKE